MLTKGARTRKRIIAIAAPIFNVKGFAGTSIADVLEAADIEKGALYRHFASKDELALAAFDFAARKISIRRALSQTAASTALERLDGCIRAVEWSVRLPTIAGGCPIMNTAIEADDTHPRLRERAAGALLAWQKQIAQIVEAGVEGGELRTETDAMYIASMVTSVLEGALLVSTLLQDPSHMDRIAAHLRTWLRRFRAPKGRAHASSPQAPPTTPALPA